MRTTGAWQTASGTLITQRDTALPDPPPNAKGAIASIEADNVAAFARDLRVLRAKAGLDYPDMAEKSHYTMRTLASAAGGLRLPTLPVLIAYVRACGGDVAEWEERWGKLIRSGKKGQTALPAAGSLPSSADPHDDADRPPGDGRGGEGGRGADPGPQGPRRAGEVYVITSAPQRDGRW
jgi:Helix-turn-helix domain